MKKSFFDKLTGSSKVAAQDAAAADAGAAEAEGESGEGQLTIDVYQTDSDVVIASTVAGVSADDIDITVTGDMITVRGKRSRPEEVPQENFYYQECYWGPFSRSVILPVDVDADRIEASIKNGILMVRLPKVEKEKTRKIAVKVT